MQVSPLLIMADNCDINFAKADEFYWSAENNTVYYDPERLHTAEGVYRLIHEIGHAANNHKNFLSGIQLLSLEAEAWESARQIAEQYDVVIAEDYIEKCLDSYRDWLHTRSTCPACKTVSVEATENQYKCFNCLQKWTVSSDQRTRCYRQKINNVISY